MNKILKWFKTNLMEGSTVDGTNLITDAADFTVGASVYVVTPDGNLPCPDGQYQTNDNKTFTTVNGIITESTVSLAVVEPTDPEDNVILDAIANLTSMVKDLIQTVSQMVDEEKAEDANEADSTEMSKEIEKLKAELSSANRIIEEGKAASAVSVTKISDDKSEQKLSDFEKKLSVLKNLQKK